jgi:hypothetical protein
MSGQSLKSSLDRINKIHLIFFFSQSRNETEKGQSACSGENLTLLDTDFTDYADLFAGKIRLIFPAPHYTLMREYSMPHLNCRDHFIICDQLPVRLAEADPSFISPQSFFWLSLAEQ